MIQNISSANTAQVAQVAQAKTPAPVPTPAAPKEDSVHLSPKAQAAASGDVDHDGDSH